ncbi:MAG: hypothetical protein H7293_11010 [Candidatus Saccharibacteria bacterium]|nr:hypothetical protein [Rhodoferax sp.]
MTDAIYARDLMNLNNLSTIQLKKYAALAHDVYGFYDLSNVALSILDERTGSRFSGLYLKRLTPKND